MVCVSVRMFSSYTRKSITSQVKSYEACSRDLRKLATAAWLCPATFQSTQNERPSVNGVVIGIKQSEQWSQRPKQIVNRLIMKHLHAFIRIFKRLNSKSATVYGATRLGSTRRDFLVVVLQVLTSERVQCAPIDRPTDRPSHGPQEDGRDLLEHDPPFHFL